MGFLSLKFYFYFLFVEISGPPDFLNNFVQEQASAKDVERQRGRHGGWKNRSEKELPAGKVSIDINVYIMLFYFD